MNSAFIRMLCGAVALLAANRASATVIFDESVNGDLSNDRLAPTVLAVSIGTNSVIGTTGLSGDRDYFTFAVPVGDRLSGLTPAAYAGTDGTSFIGIETGNQITVPFDTTSAAGLLGWSHFGTDVGNIGTDILPSMGTNGFGSTGFTPPLPSGTYSFWIQQGENVNTAYQLDFKITAVPEPSTAGLAMMASLAAAAIVLPRRAR